MVPTAIGDALWLKVSAILMARCRHATAICTVSLIIASCGCRGRESAREPDKPPAQDSAVSRPPTADSPRPNVLWIVWDTVRADRMSLYGYGKSTTPYLDVWAQHARVFDNCLSTSCWTVPVHASMFTGLLPSEHGADHDHLFLDDIHDTLAELLKTVGYQTFLYSANPHITKTENFTQGFDVEEHPWDDKYRQRALDIVRDKISPIDQSSELPGKIKSGRFLSWDIKATGELAGVALKSWLSDRDPTRPYFAFLNYMEAHRPFIPRERFRRQVMDAQTLKESYSVDRSWTPLWEYVFGLREYTQRELDVMAATYDATLAELDSLVHDLLTDLDSSDLLDNTIIIITSDHGEFLGEHHLLDHQYALYPQVLHVPLILRFDSIVQPGRDPAPVMNFDLFPTLLRLCQVDASKQPTGAFAVDLFSPDMNRLRCAEYNAYAKGPMNTISRLHPEWDPAQWKRRLRTLIDGSFQFTLWSDGQMTLYDIAQDPSATNDLVHRKADVARNMATKLNSLLSNMRNRKRSPVTTPALSDKERRVLESLGYIEGDSGD